jgi:hypothetical protein
MMLLRKEKRWNLWKRKPGKTEKAKNKSAKNLNRCSLEELRMTKSSEIENYKSSEKIRQIKRARDKEKIRETKLYAETEKEKAKRKSLWRRKLRLRENERQPLG